MTVQTLRHIKHAQRESYFTREIVSLMQKIAMDDQKIFDLYVTRVSLSHNRGSCTVFLGTFNGNEEGFDEKLRQLVLYKPSLRTGLAKLSHTRCVPELFFRFDDRLKKIHRMEKIFDELKSTGQL